MHVGIIGCGQLARMLALAGWNMGLKFSFLADKNESTRCIRGLGRVTTRSPAHSAQQVYIALGEPDVITVEREHVDIELLRGLREHCAVYPDPAAIETCGNRILEKQLLGTLDLPTAPNRVAYTSLQVADAADALGLPVVLKSAMAGYDGKGQWHIHNHEQLSAFCLENQAGNWLVESKINFEREISILAARSTNGDVALYPPTENRHSDGILLTSIAPAGNVSADILAEGFECMRSLLEALDYVGVLAVEFFVTDQGLLINELAPRVHNSGHWTLNSEATSQFENHLRAILGMSLGSTRISSYNGIINILGHYDRDSALRALSGDSTLTDYNKSFAPLRKQGHINVSRSSREDTLEELGRLHHCLYTDGAHGHSWQTEGHRDALETRAGG
jgi:5-(carboxyamino)imidazole ribonucleotide synthase